MNAVLVVAGASVGGVFAYRSYNYVQHDNDICLSCHLMQDPYERFSQSDHRGLGCKACHQPTPVVRANMALTQVLALSDETVAPYRDAADDQTRRLASGVGVDGVNDVAGAHGLPPLQLLRAKLPC